MSTDEEVGGGVDVDGNEKSHVVDGALKTHQDGTEVQYETMESDE